MKKILFGAALCVLLVAGIPGNARSDGDSKKGAEFISVSELEVGMTGYGLSVFKGTKIDRFGVEVIGVCYNSSPQIDMILIKVSGCGLEESGIVSGMSGSPIFIGEYPNGRLLGALAYGWSFTLESVAGVTPARVPTWWPRRA